MIGIAIFLGGSWVGLQAATPSAEVPSPLTEVRPMALLDIPDEIAPAIVPYLNCRMASAGIPVRSSRDGPVQRPMVELGADCSSSRSQAARRAETMLRDQHRGSQTERRSYVERVLSNVDDFASSSLNPQQIENKPDASNR